MLSGGRKRVIRICTGTERQICYHDSIDQPWKGIQRNERYIEMNENWVEWKT